MPGKPAPAGECPQCWQHAHDRRAHRHLRPREDCPQCVDHLRNGCPSLVPGKKSRWW
ncbi:pRL2-8 [Streptomyces dioscori]|uniref:PRL2-8 n=1 Tax=Streptomyces dioscori TaxID=2109333 RepID=A0A2P8PZA8_9ACTN|nr:MULTISPECIES: pRL2-8 [Streptomyces]PSM39332.1 pRL2-8 [Streptomyces dioscori]UPZ30011.1 pRL2-8 [Streptomyces sp. LRE541]